MAHKRFWENLRETVLFRKWNDVEHSLLREKFKKSQLLIPMTAATFAGTNGRPCDAVQRVTVLSCNRFDVELAVSSQASTH